MKHFKVKYTYDENKLETLTKKMFGEQYTFSKMSEREKGMIRNEFNLFLDAHQLTDEQLNDKEYIESLYNNYNENK